MYKVTCKSIERWQTFQRGLKEHFLRKCVYNQIRIQRFMTQLSWTFLSTLVTFRNFIP